MINEAAKYLCGMPHDIGDVIDRTMCHYMGYFPKLPCILRTCDNCGEAKFQNKLVDLNRNKLSDTRKIHDEVMDNRNGKERMEGPKFP